jgi:hypothetical protein
MSEHKKCREAECGHDMPLGMQYCPHCGRPRLFPNVDAASTQREVEGLKRRYEAAAAGALKRGARSRLADFQRFAEQAIAVMACSFAEVRRLADSDNEVFQTFYDRGASNLDKGSHVLQGKAWDTIRAAADTALFGDENKREIHFAALSPDDRGLTNYGECSVTLRSEMTVHRTSLFEENMLVFFKKRGSKYFANEELEPGFRCPWPERGRLAAAKSAARVESGTSEAEFAAILLTSGSTTAEDEFIELHVFGFMTVRTFGQVVLTRPPRVKPTKTELRDLQRNLERHGAKWVDHTTKP